MAAFYPAVDDTLTSPTHHHPSFHSSSQDPYSSSSMGGVMLCNIDVISPPTISPLTREPRSSGYPMSSGSRYTQTPYPYHNAASKRFAQHPDSSPAPGLHFPGQGLGFGLTPHESQMGFDEDGPTPGTMVRIGSKRGYNPVDSPTKRPDNKRARTTGMLVTQPSLPRTNSTHSVPQSSLTSTSSRIVSGGSLTSSTSAQLLTPSLVQNDEIDPALAGEYGGGGGLTTSISAPALGGDDSGFSIDNPPPYMNHWPSKVRRSPVVISGFENGQSQVDLTVVPALGEITPDPATLSPPSTGATPPKLSLQAIEKINQASVPPQIHNIHPSSIASTPAIPHLTHPGPAETQFWQHPPPSTGHQQYQYPPPNPRAPYARTQSQAVWAPSQQHMYPPQYPLQRALSAGSPQFTQGSPYAYPNHPPYQPFQPSYPKSHYEQPSRPASTGPFPSMRATGLPTSGTERGLFGHPPCPEPSGLQESYMAQSAYEIPLRHQHLNHAQSACDPALQQAGPSHFDGSLSLEGSPEQVHRTVGSRKYSYQADYGTSRRSSEDDDGFLSPSSLSPDPQDDHGQIPLGQPLPHPLTHLHPHPSQPYDNQYHPEGPQQLEAHIHGSSFQPAAPAVALHLAPANSSQGRGNYTRQPGLDKDFLNRLYKIAMLPHETTPDVLVKRFLCLIEGCERSLPRRSAIISHVQTHLGDKQHVCDTCGLAFVRQHDLKRHEKIHSEDKPYLCPCGKKFARGDALSRHQERPRYCIGSKVQD